MKWEIIKGKLSQGVNGIEWLVLNYSPKDHEKNGLKWWLEDLQLNRRFDAESIMKDALKVDSERFYTKHELNWWMLVCYTLTHLYLLKQFKYDAYFNFIQTMEIRKEENG